MLNLSISVDDPVRTLRSRRKPRIPPLLEGKDRLRGPCYNASMGSLALAFDGANSSLGAAARRRGR